MRITEIDQQEYGFFEDGLKPLHLWDLKRIVILAGPNGAGKTRVLNRLRSLHDSLTNIIGTKLLLSNLDQSSTASFLHGSTLHPMQLPTWHKGDNLDGEIRRSSLGVVTMGQGNISSDWIRFVVIPFVSNRLDLIDPHSLTRNECVSAGKTAERPGVDHLIRAGLSYIQRLQDQWWHVTHPQSVPSPEQKEQFIAAYRDLCALIQAILGEPLGRDVDDRATLFCKSIAKAHLSDGQRSLLIWAVALHAQNVKLKDAILTMDEPENHLHPEALIGALDRIITANTEGQIWLATHSVPLIAFLYQYYSDDVTLVFMDQGKAVYAGRQPERVLESLMGGAENIEALRQFVDLPEQLAANRFAAECLFSPDVIDAANSDDPQVKLAERAIFPANPTEPIQVLDFGAGHGRLLDSLAAEAMDELKARLDYVGFDPTKSARCAEVIDRVYGSGASGDRLFIDLNGLAGRRTPHSFDAVVMCNVLHEVDPVDWLEVFGTAGAIAWSMKPDGKLVIIEDYLMPKGEYAHPYGFIVLDTAALQALFGDCPIELIPAVDKKYEGRIKAHVVPGNALANVTAQTRTKALALTRDHAGQRIRELRKKSDKTYRSGQEHAFWVQQYANTSLALSHFG